MLVWIYLVRNKILHNGVGIFFKAPDPPVKFRKMVFLFPNNHPNFDVKIITYCVWPLRNCWVTFFTSTSLLKITWDVGCHLSASQWTFPLQVSEASSEQCRVLREGGQGQGWGGSLRVVWPGLLLAHTAPLLSGLPSQDLPSAAAPYTIYTWAFVVWFGVCMLSLCKIVVFWPLKWLLDLL